MRGAGQSPEHVSKRDHAEVFEQDLQPDEEEQDTACEFRLAAEFSAGFCADEHAREGYDESCAADERDRRPDVDGQEGERHSDRECVYAGGDGHHKERPDAEPERFGALRHEDDGGGGQLDERRPGGRSPF